jgi:hypothetical protein
MVALDLDSLVDRLLPQILADRELGDGRIFTRLHFRHLWALSCLQIGECYDEELLATCIPAHLPPHILRAGEAAGAGRYGSTQRDSAAGVVRGTALRSGAGRRIP